MPSIVMCADFQEYTTEDCVRDLNTIGVFHPRHLDNCLMFAQIAVSITPMPMSQEEYDWDLAIEEERDDCDPWDVY